MNSFLTPAAERYLLDWSAALSAGGALFVLAGLLIGWIIWRNARRLALDVEEKNRTALSDYEKTSEEVSRVKSELAPGPR